MERREEEGRRFVWALSFSVMTAFSCVVKHDSSRVGGSSKECCVKPSSKNPVARVELINEAPKPFRGRSACL
ncbi:hypothetical protein CEXT_441931 [Caerostris extrusa]|uniref:Secreted protein n=1 Tax=Caerostris extrusa TaxID=172846 RepID=A0AAV4Y1F0_CAEEX|nr:hypothetical protein CEXT_441931 [Caerostris extrusa]